VRELAVAEQSASPPASTPTRPRGSFRSIVHSIQPSPAPSGGDGENGNGMVMALERQWTPSPRHWRAPQASAAVPPPPPPSDHLGPRSRSCPNPAGWIPAEVLFICPCLGGSGRWTSFAPPWTAAAVASHGGHCGGDQADQPGPAAFRPVARGPRRQPFWIYKFTTMVPDAEATSPAFASSTSRTGPRSK